MPAAPEPLAAPRPTRKGERTAERILDTAEALFAEKGYAGTSLRDVASAAGLRIPSLYNHFDGKDALYAAVLERGIGPILTALGEGVASSGDPRAFAEGVFRLLAARPNLPRLVQHEVLSGAGHLSPILRDWFKPALAQAEETLRATPGAERWRPEQIPLLVVAFYQVAVGYFAMAPLMQALGDEDWLRDEALERQTEFFADLVQALLPDPERS